MWALAGPLSHSGQWALSLCELWQLEPFFSTKDAYVVGDAAGLTNPITKGGVHVGMLSGQYAAIAIQNELGTGELVPPSHSVNCHELRGQYWEKCEKALHPNLESHVWYDRIMKRQPWTQQKFVDQSKRNITAEWDDDGNLLT